MLTAGIFLAVTAVPYVLVHPERRVLLRGVPDSRSGVRQGNVDRVRASRHVRPVLRATKTFGKEGFYARAAHVRLLQAADELGEE